MVQIIVSIPGDKADCKDWAIIELQGDLETRYPVPLSGKFIGDLHFTHKDAPILIIGHHILHGKVITLEKPLAVITKGTSSDLSQVDAMETETNETSQSESQKSESEGSTCYLVKAIIKKKILFKTRPKPIIAHVPKTL